MYERIFRNGENIFVSFELGEEKDEFKERLDDFVFCWNVVKGKVDDWKLKIDEVVVVVKCYYDLL